MLDLQAMVPLRRAWDYPRPRGRAEVLPVVYGDMTLAADQGQWRAVCVDTESFVYALAGHRLLAVDRGNQVTLFDRAGQVIDPDGYSLDLAHDFAGQGVIATATFSAEAKASEPITVRAMGKPGSDGRLLENPYSVAADFLTAVCGAEAAELDPTSLSTAWSRAEELGYRAAGVITAPCPMAAQLTELIGCFLGSWWRAGDGRIQLTLDLGYGSAGEAELSTGFSESDLKGVEVSARLDNLVNRAEVFYARCPLTGEYGEADDGADTRDLASQGLYGEIRRQLHLPWVRSAAVARTIAGRMVGLLGSVRRVITFTDTSLANIHLERGDAALLSLSWLADETGRPLVNQVVRVLAIEPHLDRGTVDFTCWDTGFFRTRAQRADGRCRADASGLAGGRRDRRTL